MTFLHSSVVEAFVY